jgi:hypothetical protein
LKHSKKDKSPPIYFDPRVDTVVVDCLALCRSLHAPTEGLEKLNFEFIQCLQIEGVSLARVSPSLDNIVMTLDYDEEFDPPGALLAPSLVEGLRKVVFVLQSGYGMSTTWSQDSQAVIEKSWWDKGEVSEGSAPPSSPRVLILRREEERRLVNGDWY